MSRKKKLFLNTTTGILKQLVVVICGFVLPRYLLINYGSSVYGLVSSITHFLSFVSLLDMGVGAVVKANLYKPLADKDNHQISCIVKSSERFFRKIAYIFIVYIVVLCVVFPIIHDDFDIWYTGSLVLIISISILAEYLFGMTYELLLDADQKLYIPLSMQIFTTGANTVLAVVLMNLGLSIHIVKLVTAFVFILRPLGQMIYVHSKYDIDRKIKLDGEPIKQKWNGFSQHLASVVCQNIDVVVLTIFSSYENVSVYSVYFIVTNGVQQIIMTAASGLESLFGNMIAKNENDNLIKAFEMVEIIVHVGVTIIFSIAAIMIIPFVRIYTRDITDADYIAPLFSILIVIAYASQCLRIPYFRIIKAAGHFKETQNGAFISAALNVIITVTLVFKFGLIGAAIGTLVAMIYHTSYFVVYLRKNILYRSIKYFILYIITDLIVAFLSFWLSRRFIVTCDSYGEWIILAIKMSLLVIIVGMVVYGICYLKKIKKLILYWKK